MLTFSSAEQRSIVVKAKAAHDDAIAKGKDKNYAYHLGMFMIESAFLSLLEKQAKKDLKI